MPRLKLHPLFLSLIIFIIMTGKFILFVNMIVAVILHELAHTQVARGRGYVIEQMVLMPYGAVIRGREDIAKEDALAIYMAGPALNAIIATLMISLWWLIPALYEHTRLFVIANLALSIFNLIPVYPLDGAKILMNLMKNKLLTLKILQILGIILSFVMFAVFIATSFTEINFTLGIAAVFLFAGAVTGNSKEKYHHMTSRAPFVKNLKDGMKKDNVIIPEDMPLFRILKFLKPDIVNTFEIVNNKMQTIRILSEDEMRIIFEKHDITRRIGEII